MNCSSYACLTIFVYLKTENQLKIYFSVFGAR